MALKEGQVIAFDQNEIRVLIKEVKADSVGSSRIIGEICVAALYKDAMGEPYWKTVLSEYVWSGKDHQPAYVWPSLVWQILKDKLPAKS